MGAQDEPRSAHSSRRVFVEDLSVTAGEVRLSGNTSRYVARVLRLIPGDSLVLFDGSGWEHPSTIREVGRDFVRVRVHAKRRGVVEPSLQVVLAVALLKGQKLDLVVQKAVELGVREIRPMATSRTVKVLDNARARERVCRWQKISREAARQCGRADVPLIRSVASLEEVFSEAAFPGIRILLSENAGRPLRTMVRGLAALPTAVLLAAGPEGGFSSEEEALAGQRGFIPVNLGPRTLRAETAAILGVGLVQFAFGDLGGPSHPRTRPAGNPGGKQVVAGGEP